LGGNVNIEDNQRRVVLAFFCGLSASVVSMLRRNAEQKNPGSLAVEAHYGQDQIRPTRLSGDTHDVKILRHLLPGKAGTPRRTYSVQIIFPLEFSMCTVEALCHNPKPTQHQPGRDFAVRIHIHRGPVASFRACLPETQSQQQCADHCTHGVLMVRNQLYRQERNRRAFSRTFKPSNRYPFLLENGK